MSIMFQCPECGVTIRVPEPLRGRAARCPRCSCPIQAPIEAPLPEDEGAAEIQTTERDTRPGLRNAAEATLAENLAASPVPHDQTSDDDVAARILADPLPSPSMPARRTQRERSGRHRRPWLPGIAGLLLLLLIAILAAVTISRLPDLSGELSANPVPGKMLGPWELPWSETGLSEDVQQSLQQVLTTKPEVIVSDLMVCVLKAGSTGIDVSLQATDRNAWFLVDPSADAALAAWARRQQQPLTELRTRDLRDRMASYSRDKRQASDEQTAAMDMPDIRDGIGLNSGVQGLGYVLEAVAGSRVSRCVREDERGRLYFLLPRETAAFVIRGRRLADGRQPFSGIFQVTVQPGNQGNSAPLPTNL
jgi:hypothetical protein